MTNAFSKFAVIQLNLDNFAAEREQIRANSQHLIKGMATKFCTAVLWLLAYNYIQRFGVDGLVVKRALPQLPPLPTLDIIAPTKPSADEALPPDNHGKEFRAIFIKFFIFI